MRSLCLSFTRAISFVASSNFPQKERQYSSQQLCLLRADAANELFKAGESSAAIAAYSTIVLVDCPDTVKFAVLNNRGALHLQQGRAEAALADFSGALDVTPGNIDAMHNKASVSERSNERKRTVRHGIGFLLICDT